jgi:hypothetical protein
MTVTTSSMPYGTNIGGQSPGASELRKSPSSL